MMPRKRDIASSLRHLLRRKRVEDRGKIEDTIRDLNGGKDGPWDEIENFTFLPAARFNPATKSFSPMASDKGIVVKIFANPVTGETKMYWADIFIKRDETK